MDSFRREKRRRGVMVVLRSGAILPQLAERDGFYLHAHEEGHWPSQSLFLK